MTRTGKLRRAAALAIACACLGAAPQAGAQITRAPTQADIDQAKKHMAAGVAFMQDPEEPKYEEAYREFQKAHDLSGSLNALLNLGICTMKLERDGEAIEHFDRFLRDKGKDIEPEERAQVERDLQALKTSVAWVWLSSDKPDVLVTDQRTPSRGEPVRNSYRVGASKLKLGIHPGAHAFTATLAGYPEQAWRVEVANGGEYQHQFKFEGTEAKPDAPATGTPDEGLERPVPWYVWLSGGLTLATAVPMTIFMVTAKSAQSEYEDEIKGKKPLEEQDAARDDVSTKNLLADVFLGVTAVGAVTTVVLLLTRPEVKKEAAARGWRVAPIATPAGGGAAISGTF